MATLDQLTATIQSIHAAGLDEACWPRALAAIAGIVGGNAASIEVVDRQSKQHREMHSYGLPGAEEIAFLPEFPKLNIRFPFVARQKINELLWDFKIFDESVMRRAPFYTEIMPRFDIRYFVSSMIVSTESEFAALAVHRSARMGHVERDGIAMTRLLTPHVRQAFDVTRRLRSAHQARSALENTLDWLADGVALLRADGRVVYCNESFQAVARRADGIRLRKGMIEITDGEARDGFHSVVAAALKTKAGAPDSGSDIDLAVRRRAGGPAYVVSVRPLFEAQATQPPSATAIVFVHDPLSHGAVTISALRDRFGLTEAEAALAQALQSGLTVAAYARQRSVSLNTVYTHLRHLREKTGCNRMPELIHKLNDLQGLLRTS